MAHSHLHHPDVHVPARTARLLRLAAAAGAVLTLLGLVLLRPTGHGREGLRDVAALGPLYDARVTSVDLGECA